jgi:hypothetical protein
MLETPDALDRAHAGHDDDRKPVKHGAPESANAIDEAAANHLREIGPELEWKGMHSGSDEERERKQADLLASWEQLIAQRLDYSRDHSIARVLADHAKSDKHTNLRARARTWNFGSQFTLGQTGRLEQVQHEQQSL